MAKDGINKEVWSHTVLPQFELDAEELLYVDFDREEVVSSIPRFLIDDPNKILENLNVFRNAKKNGNTCSTVLAIYKAEEKNPPEEMSKLISTFLSVVMYPPGSILYPSEEVQLGVENILICFVNHFYPPEIKVSWTRNVRLVFLYIK
ncbi:RLA class II histocompatibility antigen, DP alpha-1 chain-like [Anarhichas minor]|uniref:RLA class II histocompatibility antigen, DP alpha-1 chain-like n=1 Tax=Anarhichas minor TaxID=65739 RepID=UPI003F73DC05